MKLRAEIIALALATAAVIASTACNKSGEGGAASSEGSKDGIGPVKSLSVGPGIDDAMAKKGKELFEAKCSACHKFDEKVVGPGVGGVTKRRSPAWIMNMILNPVEMTQKDPQAQALLAEHLTQMTFQNVSESDARAMLEYFRQHDAGK